MAQPAPATTLTPAASRGYRGPAEPVPVAFCGRTSTLELQDPVASLRRQIRSSQAWLPPGWFIAARYWDVESGGLDLEARSQGEAYKRFAAAGIPRDGGMAELLAEAAGPAPQFAAVICEDIERSGRDTFNALKLKRNCPATGSRYSRPTSPPTSTGSMPPPFSSGGSSRGSRNGSGCS